VSEGTPLWLKGVLRAERLVGSRVESAVHSDTYFNVVTQVRRSKGRVTGTVEGVSKRIIHLANLPAGTDIRRMREQLSRMERRMVELSKELEGQAAQRQLDPRTDHELELEAEHPKSR
jgi:TolA-binding protein